MAAAASRIELALCFEDVAKNIFGNADGTMTRCAPYEPGVPHRSNARKASSSPPVFLNNDASVAPVSAAHLVPLVPMRNRRAQLAAILAADTGLGLQQQSSRCSSPSLTSPWTTGSPRTRFVYLLVPRLASTDARGEGRARGGRRRRRRTRARPRPGRFRSPRSPRRRTRRRRRPGRGRSRPGQKGVGEALGSRRRRRRLMGAAFPARFPPDPAGAIPAEKPRRTSPATCTRTRTPSSDPSTASVSTRRCRSGGCGARTRCA